MAKAELDIDAYLRWNFKSYQCRPAVHGAFSFVLAKLPFTHVGRLNQGV
ncbi:hypothetical protein VCHENC02_5846 [Vibrio harveyi]|uniref:Uncharacterized protein n=1 Tax=Vibrio harveyi TaxID=669 RepID=A0A454CP89_VIBHA|nr:hypothetical protein VCHENC02_5846 [Vibrio harveyi]